MGNGVLEWTDEERSPYNPDVVGAFRDTCCSQSHERCRNQRVLFMPDAQGHVQKLGDMGQQEFRVQRTRTRSSHYWRSELSGHRWVSEHANIWLEGRTQSNQFPSLDQKGLYPLASPRRIGGEELRIVG